VREAVHFKKTIGSRSVATIAAAADGCPARSEYSIEVIFGKLVDG
jgi:hypothetical protein